MNIADAVERPTKKRRFFVEDSAQPASPPALETRSRKDASPDNTEQDITPPVIFPNTATSSQNVFDVDLLTAVVGEQLPASTLQKLQELSKGNLERGNVVSAFTS
jgi:hypothetical protein